MTQKGRETDRHVRVPVRAQTQTGAGQRHREKQGTNAEQSHALPQGGRGSQVPFSPSVYASHSTGSASGGQDKRFSHLLWPGRLDSGVCSLL